MIITTKFDINDAVYIMYDNKICKGEITGFTFTKSNNLCSWTNNNEYCINILSIKQECITTESKIFKTKEELISSL